MENSMYYAAVCKDAKQVVSGCTIIPNSHVLSQDHIVRRLLVHAFWKPSILLIFGCRFRSPSLAICLLVRRPVRAASDVAPPTSTLCPPHKAQTDDDERNDEPEELEGVFRLDPAAVIAAIAATVEFREKSGHRLR